MASDHPKAATIVLVALPAAAILGAAYLFGGAPTQDASTHEDRVEMVLFLIFVATIVRR